MATLFVISTQPRSGKTAFCASLGSRFLSEGLKVGYVKPVATEARAVEGWTVDEDVVFMKDTLDLAQTWDVLSPVTLTEQQMELILQGKGDSLQERLKAAINVAEKGRDVLILEGAGAPWVGSMVGLSARRVAELSNAQVLLAARYDGPATADQIMGAADGLSSRLLGAVITMIPQEALDRAGKSLAPFLRSQGVPVLGLLAEDRSLMGVTVGELAAFLDGEFLRGQDKEDDLVEGFLMGALSTDYMQDYYTRRQNVAVITSGEKTDIQLFSMTPNTRCIVLTGYRRPAELVVAQAGEHGIPLIMVKEDTLTVAERVEGLFAGVRFHQRRKLPTIARVLEAGLDLSALYKGLSLAARVS